MRAIDNRPYGGGLEFRRDCQYKYSVSLFGVVDKGVCFGVHYVIIEGKEGRLDGDRGIDIQFLSVAD